VGNHSKVLILLVTMMTVSLFSQEKKETNPFSFKWDNGFKVDSEDKNFRLKFGGRIMWDHAYFNQNDALDASFGELESVDGTEFRRVRFFMSGLLYKNFEFKLNVDFAGGVTRLKDAYIGVRNIPIVGTVRVGHVKEPLRFDALTSSKYIVFLERGIPADISNERNNGILMMNDFFNNKLSVQAGVFRNADGNGNDKFADESVALTYRITSLVIQNPEKKSLLHLGASHSYRKPDRDEYIVSIRPKSHLSKKYISTGNIPNVDKINIFNAEAVFSKGPFTAQAEYLTDFVHQESEDISQTYNFENLYVQVGYFLTGEFRPYKNSYDTFGRVKPHKNFMDDGKGAGAFELALRYGYTNLNSRDIRGGTQGDITMGLNWYLNPASRVMLNYVFTDISKPEMGGGNLNIFEIRFQVDF
jgi:phosphate-selective porin OprO/OprP